MFDTKNPDALSLSRMMDQTLLKAFASDEQLQDFCRDGASKHYASICVNSAAVSMCSPILKGTDVRMCAVVGFPLGQTTITMKTAEAIEAIENGAQEIDYVVNVGKVKSGRWDYIEQEMTSIVTACHDRGALCKVIFENCYLTDEEKAGLCRVAVRVKPDFVKTSTGFGTGGATVEDVRLMRTLVGPEMGVKAAGGIRTLEDALSMIEAGATRIGTSAGEKILAGLNK